MHQPRKRLPSENTDRIKETQLDRLWPRRRNRTCPLVQHYE